jgi:hypothetical protein
MGHLRRNLVDSREHRLLLALGVVDQELVVLREPCEDRRKIASGLRGLVHRVVDIYEAPA